jgi:hypothetical protein
MKPVSPSDIFYRVIRLGNQALEMSYISALG